MYYFGHHKCATNWMRLLLHDVCLRRVWGWTIVGGMNTAPMKPARGRPTVVLNPNSNVHHVRALKPDERAFHLYRDPRDALVSGYWSWRNSHKNNHEELIETRKRIQELSVEDGLFLMLDKTQMLHDLKDWAVGDYPNVLDVRYEDLLEKTPATLERIFDHLGIEPEPGEYEMLATNHAFQSVTGRNPGQEDVNQHLRKGIAGDWINAFTPKIAQAFRDRYQPDLVRLGYETDDAWVAQVTDTQPTNA